jgi:hypothetical protein
MKSLEIHTMLKAMMKNIACNDEEILNLFIKERSVPFVEFTRTEQKKMLKALKNAVNVLKNEVDYNLFSEYNLIVLDDLRNGVV